MCTENDKEKQQTRMEQKKITPFRSLVVAQQGFRGVISIVLRTIEELLHNSYLWFLIFCYLMVRICSYCSLDDLHFLILHSLQKNQ